MAKKTSQKQSTKKSPPKSSTPRKKAAPKPSEAKEEKSSEVKSSESKKSPKKKTKEAPKKSTKKKSASPSAESPKETKVAATKKAPKKSAPKKSEADSPSEEKPAKFEREIKYPELECQLFDHETKLGEKTMKEMLGWREESENIKFGNDYLFKDLHDRKIRLIHNTRNRGFELNLAIDWKIEILKRRWKLNGETIILDKTGEVQSGQHRGVGLILAIQEIELHPGKWREYWAGEEPYLPTFVICGIDTDDETINTIDVGKPRSLADVIFRSPFFADMSVKDRKSVARICSYAIKLIWQRTGFDQNSFMTRRAHSESLEFLLKHERILEAVKHVHAERESLSPLLPIGYAAGMLYLMGSSATHPDNYEGGEDSLDWSLWDDACDFWVLLSNGEKTVKSLADKLQGLDLTGAFFRDEVCSLVAKAWVLVTEKRPITEKSLALTHEEDELGRSVLTDYPTTGGIDQAGHVVEEEEE